ncbi:ABC transporter permease [Sedimentibacter sp. zth1]|uniref:ABC transporter permease n=1 Tax=Sedimentibacter sp. zth1 TaxID=2816908 RepID=UPI001A9206AC|nr:ABC transporter permease [Sedimentibacter sp. zth1]QSX04946.1 ABC transporter permease [Sedimentibacter sp. zth1]
MSNTTKFNVFRTAVAIIIALAISFGIILLVSEEPVTAILKLITGPLQKSRYFGNVIEAMIPLIFTGVGVSIMFTANQINLAGEGSFHIGGLVASVIAIYVTLPLGLHPIVCILLAGLAGSVVTLIPALMKVKTNADELVSSLMINYLVLFFCNFILLKVIRDPVTGAGSYLLPKSASLSVIFSGTRIHTGLILAILVALLGYLFLYKTKIGYEIRLTGENEKFAKYSGINVVKVVLISQLVGGFICGIGGGVEILNPIYDRFTWAGLLGYGWDAIIILTLAKKNPLYVPVSAFFLAYLRTGASIMARATDVSAEIVLIIQGIIIVLIVANQFLSKYKNKMIEKEAKKNLNIKEAE